MSSTQGGWRSCSKCQGMHFAEIPNFEGVCPAGGQHDHTNSFLYALTFNAQPGPNVQTGWASCPRCQGMHFAGHPVKGVCPAGGQHSEANSFAYALTHDVAATPTLQTEWRSCPKCQGLFFGPFNGRCPAGGTHSAQGSFNYALPFTPAVVTPKTSVWTWQSFSAGKVTVESASLTISNSGEWTWTAGLHDSSTLFGDSWAFGFAFNKLGHGDTASGTLGATLSGPSADSGFTHSGKDPWLAANFDAADAAGVSSALHVEGDLSQVLSALLDDLETLAEIAGKFVNLAADPDSEPTDPGEPGSGDGNDADAVKLANLPRDPKASPVSAHAIPRKR